MEKDKKRGEGQPFPAKVMAALPGHGRCFHRNFTLSGIKFEIKRWENQQF